MIAVDFAIAKVSTKGQIVIPSFFRNNIHSGDEFLMVKDENRIVLKNMKDVAKDIRDDIVFAKRIDKAWNDYKNGKFITKSKDDFLKELDAC